MRAGRNLGHRQPPSGGAAPPDCYLTNPSVGVDCACAVLTGVVGAGAGAGAGDEVPEKRVLPR